MTLSPTALEEAAKAMEPNAFETLSRGYTQRNYFENRAFLNAEKVVRRANKKATAAITAYLAQAGKECWVLVPAGTARKVTSIARRNEDAPEIAELSTLLAAAQNGGK